MRLSAVAALLAPLLWAGQAVAHSNIPAPATITNPPRIVAQPTDGGDRTFDAYPFPTADASFEVTWEDGDFDPIAEHFFYYLDHAPPLALSVAAVKAMATPIPESAGGFFVSCSCVEDMAMPTVCPDVGTRDCRNAFTWDTSALPAGAYWLVAMTRDPPYDVYTVADGPVRISHASPPPPGVIVVRPDGFGTFDKTYRARWLLGGTPPYRVDLSFASDEGIRAGAAFTDVAADVPLVAGTDATYGYDWDLSALPSARIYHLRAKVTDATGQSVYSDSRAGVTVFHPGDNPDIALPGVGDMATARPGDGGCSCDVSGAAPAPALLVALGLASAWIARRARRRS